MSDQNVPASASRPSSGSSMTPNQKLVMWLVIAAIPVGILIYALVNRNNMAPVNNGNLSVNQTPAPSNNAAMEPITPTATPVVPTSTQTPAVPVSASAYKDGTYSAKGNYVSPGGSEDVDVTLTIKDGVVTDSTFKGNATRPISVKLQGEFAAGYQQFVVGKKLADLNVGKVSGASLTPKGFNDAVAKIKTAAKS